ncbi:MAG TPA: hypothetical protein VKU02_25680 [Gemmataceae bacterium]|nr:hypothetical protein [Gemmataceae bacterium]
MSLRPSLLALAVAGSLMGTSGAWAEPEKKTTKELVSFGTLPAPSPEQVRGQALTWLKAVGKSDDAHLKTFEQIWSTERPVLDRVAQTLALGDEEAAKVLTEARDPSKAAPTAIPAMLKDSKKPAFYKANLALAFAKALSNRRIYEEALETLKVVKPEQVVDPASYLFHRAVAEHALLLKDQANRTVLRLLDDAVDVPDRYKMVAVLMALDMQSWREKDLGEIARKMDNIERRLELARGGPQTQKIQKEVVARLDELIKQMENQAKGASQSNGGSCPNGGQQQPGNGQRPGAPMPDSRPATNGGPGHVDPKKLEGLAKQWGKLPEKERAEAMQELTRDLPPKYREVIETYFRKLAASDSSKP